MLYILKISWLMMVISKINVSFSALLEYTTSDNDDYISILFCYFSHLFINCILVSDGASCELHSLSLNVIRFYGNVA